MYPNRLHALQMFFKNYQINALEALWNSDRDMSNRNVWEAVGEKNTSRASIINFLNDAVNIDLLTVDYTTGKVGHRGIYKPKRDKKRTKEYIKNVFLEKLEKF